MLGVLSAGCSYLALAPNDPVAHTRRLIKSVGVIGVVATRELGAALYLPDVRVFDVDEFDDSPVDDGNFNLPCSNYPIYVLTTSGSTGGQRRCVRATATLPVVSRLSKIYLH